MESYEYQRLYEFEDFYWWHQGVHGILLDVLKELRPAKDAVILDAGCGTGKNMVNISSLTPQVFGFDISPQAVSFCRQRGISQVEVASINHIPFPDAFFDVVLAIDVLECEAVDPDRAYRELCRVVKPSGFIILFVPAHSWLEDKDHHRAVHVIRRYNKKKFSLLLNSPSVKVMRLTYVFAMVFPAIVFCRLAKLFLRKESAVPYSSLRRLPGFLNKILSLILKMESCLLKRINMPWGSSILAVVQKEV